MKLKVFTADGSKSEEKDFPQFPEFEGEKGLAALRQVVLAQQANKRQGNASTKTRAEVSGTGKKLFRQKGMGTARQGERRVPHQRHGGVAHGPKPRDYSQKINRKMNKLAFQRALFERATEGGLSVIEALEVKEPKTKLFNKVLTSVLPKHGKVLIVDDAFENNAALAARNIEGVSLSEAGNLSVLDLVRFRQVLISSKGIETILARANGGES
ncbi:50S ribosomal protein L4 [Coraliomargarita parva]|uniref:50S ribosomal protein L4 n=1 Tax=Coraliomargarita parva TaxID=3014050 RepID=UPI0022B53374|nr:50S ribosomal protein L4 [Coraliomargarita parva]